MNKLRLLGLFVTCFVSLSVASGSTTNAMEDHTQHEDDGITGDLEISDIDAEILSLFNPSSVKNKGTISKNNNKKYKCTQCTYATDHGGAIHNHRLTHKERQFKCDKCTYAASRQDILTRHKRLKHEKRDSCKWTNVVI